MSEKSIRTVAEILDVWADLRPQRPAVGYVADLRSGNISHRLTYRALRSRAIGICSLLIRNGCRAGDRAVLAFGPGLEFVEAFFACAFTGVIAVPAPLPGRSRTSRDRFSAIVDDAHPKVILTDESSRAALGAWTEEHPGCVVLCCDSEAGMGTDADRAELSSVDPADVALLQYTSGSTSDPKGVIVTHGNIISNLRSIARAVGPEDVGVCGWLPLTHDMGLIGQLLFPLFTGGWSYSTSPTEFVKRPLGWLELISRYGAEISVAPNFAYALCARAAAGSVTPGIDLSGWRHALNGAEPVEFDTLESFASAFRRYGFRTNAFMPTYGLAEATLLVSAERRDISPVILTVDRDHLAVGRVSEATGRATQRLVSCGEFELGTVVIVDPQTRDVLADDAVGEIWVSSPCVARGYWQKPELTAQVFEATLSDGRGGYLRTGDLGFVHEQSLYISGRIKDVIVWHGRNLYPHDIETAVMAESGEFSAGAAAVLGMDDDRGVVVIQELGGAERGQPELASAASRIKRVLAEEFGVGRTSVIFVPPRTMRYTTSGKLRRATMKQLFVASALEKIYEAPAPEMSR